MAAWARNSEKIYVSDKAAFLRELSFRNVFIGLTFSTPGVCMIQKVSAVALIFLLLLALLLTAGNILYPAPPAAAMQFDKNQVDIGLVQGDGKLQVEFKVHNTGDAELSLKRNDELVKNDAVGATEELQIAPGESQQVVVAIDKSSLGGKFEIEVPYVSNDESQPKVSFFVKGYSAVTQNLRRYDVSMQARYLRE